MTSLEQLLQQFPQATAPPVDVRFEEETATQGTRNAHPARRRSASSAATRSTGLSESIPVPSAAAASMSAYHQRRTRDFLSRDRRSSSSSRSSSGDEQDDTANNAFGGAYLYTCA